MEQHARFPEGITIIHSLSGPAGGVHGVASTNFTVSLPAGAKVSGVTVKFHDKNNGGSFTPSNVSLSTKTPSATFTYTPATAGTKSINADNNGGHASPPSLTYTAT